MATVFGLESLAITSLLLLTGMQAMASQAEPSELLLRSTKLGFYCSSKDNVVVATEDFSGKDSPRIRGLTKNGPCEWRQELNAVELLCGRNDGPVSLIIEYDNQDHYNLAKVSCPVRPNARFGPQRSRAPIGPQQSVERMGLQQSHAKMSQRRSRARFGPLQSLVRREAFRVAAKIDTEIDTKDEDADPDLPKDTTMGKAKAVMEIGLEYNNISEIDISCHPSGQVYLTNPDTTIFKHMFSYNTKGDICITLQLGEDIVEISNCNQEEIIEISFSSYEFRDNIIGGRGELRVYKFNCTEIGENEAFYRERVLGIHDSASSTVTWSFSAICIMAGFRSLLMTSLVL